MPVDKLELNPPIQYSVIWLIIGSCLLAMIVLWYGVLFWLTRKRKARTLAQLGPGSEVLDLEGLKQKYLKLIDDCYQSYVLGRTDLRGLHRGLSMSVRYFVYEARHFPAPRLTLSDLKHAPYPNLTKVIEEYYSKEFSQIEHGDAAHSVSVAKDMVQQWT